MVDEPDRGGRDGIDVVAAKSASRDGARGRPPRLSREAILDSAIELIDRDGLQQLTMRRLGGYCGVEAMALYRHVSGREDLIGGIVDRLVEGLYEDQQASFAECATWQDYLQRLAHGVRAIAVAHPQVFPVIATRPPEAPWVRPPLRSLRWMETFLASLRQLGFDQQAAAAAYRSFTTFLLGHLLIEVAARGADLAVVAPAAEPDGSAVDDLADYPNIRELRPMLSQDHALTEFEEALEDLLDRIESYPPA